MYRSVDKSKRLWVEDLCAPVVETVLSLGVELVVLILDSYYLSYVGLYLAY